MSLTDTLTSAPHTVWSVYGVDCSQTSSVSSTELGDIGAWNGNVATGGKATTNEKQYFYRRLISIIWGTEARACLFLPARRYASAGNWDRKVSVCPSVCLSVTRRYCAKTKKAIASWFLHHLVAPRHSEINKVTSHVIPSALCPRTVTVIEWINKDRRGDFSGSS